MMKNITTMKTKLHTMSPLHLQTALNKAEQRYGMHVKLSLDHADQSEALFDNIEAIQTEAARRKIDLVSLTDKEPGAHKFLVNAHKVKTHIS